MQYDVLIRGGEVIDPSQSLRGVRDVAVKDGRIAAVAGKIDGNFFEVVRHDRSGRSVTERQICRIEFVRQATHSAHDCVTGTHVFVDADAPGESMRNMSTVLRAEHQQRCVSSAG